MKKHNAGNVGYGWVATARIPAISNSPDAGVLSQEAFFAADRSAELGRPVKMSELNKYAK